MSLIKKHKVITLIVGILIVMIIAWNVSVFPFVYLFRILMSSVQEAGTIGEYSDQIQNVTEMGTVSISVEGYPDAQATVYAPENTEDALPLIVYIHGGGYVVGSASQVSNYAKLLASNGYIVVNMDYALAPEYGYPAAVIQLAEAVNYFYQHAEDYHIDPDHIFIGGNSAGAHMSAQLGAIFTTPGYGESVGVTPAVPASSIAGLILFNGVYNMETVSACGYPGYDMLAWAYTGEKDWQSYSLLKEMSPVNYITENYPPTYITVGDADVLSPQTMEMIDKLNENNVEVTSLLWTDSGAGLAHDYVYELDTEEAQRNYEAVIEFLRDQLQ